VFDLQDKVAISVAGVIEPALQAAEMRPRGQRPTSPPTISICVRLRLSIR